MFVSRVSLLPEMEDLARLHPYSCMYFACISGGGGVDL